MAPARKYSFVLIQLLVLFSTLGSDVVRGNGSSVTLDQSYHWLTVSEDAPVGSLLLHSEFTNGNSTCQLLTDAGGAFSLSPYGALHTASVLDREDTDSYQLTVACRGESQSSPYSYIMIYINVTDAVDSFPAIDPFYQVSVPENLSLDVPFLNLSAWSPDLTVIVFSIVGGNSAGIFSIANESGSLSLQSALDYETRQNYQLVIQASSGGMPDRVNYSTIIVMVEDVLEPPIFSQNSYEFVVMESAVEGAVGCVFAYDGQGGAVTYSIDDNSSGLSVDPVTGILTYSSPSNSSHIITATAIGSMLSAAVNVTVSIIANGSPPEFSNLFHNVTVAEDVAVGTVILALEVEGDGVDAVYQMVASNQVDLAVNESSGEVFISSPLDFERQSEYLLTVTVSKSEAPSAFTSGWLQVTVIDVNESPQFDSLSYEMYIPEDRPPGTLLLVINAFDPDLGDNGSVSYSASFLPPSLSLSSDGELTVTGEGTLDRESEPVINISVIASDFEQPDLFQTVPITLYLWDLNDNRPSFSSAEIQASVLENSPPETIVTQLVATDLDAGTNAELSFSILGPEYVKQAFYLSPSGVMKTIKALDRESCSMYKIHVCVRDGGSPSLSSEAVLTVVVMDEIEGPPVFLQTNFTVFVLSPLLAGEKIAVVEAVSEDNATVVYPPLSHSSFEIGQETGLLSSLQDILEGTYDIVINATVPGYVSSVTVTISVSTSPSLSLTQLSIYVSSILYIFPSSVSLGRVGGDVEANFRLSVTTEDRASQSLFSVDPSSGELWMSSSSPGGRYLLDVSTETGESRIVMVTVAWTTNQTYEQAVLLSLTGLTREQFVEHFLDPLLAGVSALVSSNPTLQVQLVGIIALEDEVQVAIAVLQPDLQTYLPRSLLFNRLTIITGELSVMIGWKVQAVDFDFCSGEPCINFQECLEGLTAADHLMTISTDTSTVISLPLALAHSCRCPRGYTAEDGCLTDIDECSPNPCDFEAECIDLVGDYRCICPDYTSGKNCSIACPSTSCLLCNPNPCLNGGTCDDEDGRAVCKCSDGFSGPHCEMTSLHFALGSYATYPSLGARQYLALSVSFSTISPSGLVLYAGNYGSGGDMVTIELVVGQVEVGVSLEEDGESLFFGRTSAYYPLNDGVWHNVTVVVDSSQQLMDVSVSNCSVDSTVVQNGGELCVFSITLTDTYRVLDLSSSVFLGGTPPSLSPSISLPFFNSFTGCLGWLTIDGSLVDMSSLTQSSGVSSGCPPLDVLGCSQDNCVSLWNGCHCQEESGMPVSLEGNGSVILETKNGEYYQLMLFTVDIRTLDVFSVIAQLGPATIELQYGNVVFRMSGLVLVASAGLADGEWHTISLSLSASGIVLSVDGGRVNVSSSNTANLTLTTITMGMYQNASNGMVGYVGCLNDITVNDQLVPLGDGNTDHFFMIVSEAVTECSPGSPCSSLACPMNSSCKEGQCVCKPLYDPQGEQCVFPCDSQPCLNGGDCRPIAFDPRLFNCACTSASSGDLCEIGINPCNPGFHRSDTKDPCKPCVCDLNGVNSNICNRESGVCMCDDSEPWYSAEDDLGCSPCACNAMGSLSDLCNQTTTIGQCQCRKNVMGRSCDQCVAGYAGLDENGCYEAAVVRGSFVVDNVPFTPEFLDIRSPLSSQLTKKLVQEWNDAISGYALAGVQEFSVMSLFNNGKELTTGVSYEVVAYTRDAQPHPSLSILAAVLQIIVQRGRVGVFTTEISSHQTDLTCSQNPCLGGVCMPVTNSSSQSFVCDNCPQGTRADGLVCLSLVYQTCSLSGPDSDKDLVPDACDNCPYLFNPYQGSMSCDTAEGACAAEFSDNGILWAETLAGSTDQQACPKPFTGVAYRACSMSGKWEEPNLANCLSPIGQFMEEWLQELQTSPFTLDQESLRLYSQKLLELVRTPSLTGADLLVATLLLDELIIRGATYLNRDSLALLVAVTGELSGADRADQWLGLSGSSAGELITAVERLRDVATRVAVESEMPVEEGTADADLYVSTFGPGKFPGVKLMRQSPGENASSVVITQEIGGEAVNASLVYLPYLSLSLPSLSSDLLPGSPVWSIQLTGISTSPLSSPINITFPHVELKVIAEESVQCVTWEIGNGGEGSWVSDGCQLVNISAYQSICSCSHLSTFTLLVNDTALSSIPEEVVEYHPTVFAYCVLALFIVLMVVTLVFLLVNRYKKNWSVVALLSQLILALMVLNAFFVVGVDRVEITSVCTTMGVILHYLPLAVMTWLVALTVYVGVAAGCGGWGNRSCLVTSVIAWVLPVLIVAMGLLVIVFTQPSASGAYGYPSYCWLLPHLSPALLVPAGLLFLVELIVLSINFVLLSRHGHLSVLKQENQNEVKFLQYLLCCVFALFCITWNLGMAAIYSINWSSTWYPTLDSLFAISNLTLGVSITLAVIIGPGLAECFRHQFHLSTSVEKKLQLTRLKLINNEHQGHVEGHSAEIKPEEPEYQAVDLVSPHGRKGGMNTGICLENTDFEEWLPTRNGRATCTLVEMAEDWEMEYVAQNHQRHPIVHQLQTENGQQVSMENHREERMENHGLRPNIEQEATFMSESPQTSHGRMEVPDRHRERGQVGNEDEVQIEGTREPEELWYKSSSPPSISHCMPHPIPHPLSAGDGHIDMEDNDIDEVSSEVIEALYQQTKGQDISRDDTPSPSSMGVNGTSRTTSSAHTTPWYKGTSECNSHEVQPYASIPLAMSMETPPETPPPNTPPPALWPSSSQMVTSSGIPQRFIPSLSIPNHLPEPVYAEIPDQPTELSVIPPSRLPNQHSLRLPNQGGVPGVSHHGLSTADRSSSMPRCNSETSPLMVPRRDMMTSSHRPLVAKGSWKVSQAVPSSSSHAAVGQRMSPRAIHSSSGNMVDKVPSMRHFSGSQTTESLV